MDSLTRTQLWSLLQNSFLEGLMQLSRVFILAGAEYSSDLAKLITFKLVLCKPLMNLHEFALQEIFHLTWLNARADQAKLGLVKRGSRKFLFQTCAQIF